MPFIDILVALLFLSIARQIYEFNAKLVNGLTEAVRGASYKECWEEYEGFPFLMRCYVYSNLTFFILAIVLFYVGMIFTPTSFLCIALMGSILAPVRVLRPKPPRSSKC